MIDDSHLQQAAEHIRNSKYTTAFTGAGISVDSGIPPFRGENGLWTKYDSKYLELTYFHSHPLESWAVIMEIFYDFFGKAKPNQAHEVLAQLEETGLLKSVITQNIDNLHQEASSKAVIEFHGNSKQLVCTSCESNYKVGEINLDSLPVLCPVCQGLVKPDFIFFGEEIPSDAYKKSVAAAEKSEVMLVIGTTAEVMPAGQMPVLAKSRGATIIEVNPKPSFLTSTVTDIFLQGRATLVMDELYRRLQSPE